MQSPISRAPNGFTNLPNHVAGDRNHSIIDNQDNLYMTGKDAIYKGSSGQIGSKGSREPKCIDGFTPEELGRIELFEQFLFGLRAGNVDDPMSSRRSLLSLTADEVLYNINKQRKNFRIKVPVDQHRTDPSFLDIGMKYEMAGNDLHLNWLKFFREENKKGVNMKSPGAQQIRAYVTAHFPFMQPICDVFVGPNFAHEANIFFGEGIKKQMQSTISQTPNKFANLAVNSPIVAGDRNYSMIDNQGDLYMAGKDAFYKGPSGQRGPKCIDGFTPEKLGRMEYFEQFLFGLRGINVDDFVPSGRSLLSLAADEVLNNIGKQRQNFRIKVPMDQRRTDPAVLATGIKYEKAGNDIHLNWLKFFREENRKGVNMKSPGAQQIRAYVTAHFPFMQPICDVFVGPNFGHEANIFFGGETEIKISKILTKIYIDSKVINISQTGNLIGALTEDGIARIWKLKSDKFSGLATPEKWTIELTNKIGDSENKAIKVVILADDEYAVIMDDGSIRMNLRGYYRHLKYDVGRVTFGKYVDIMGSYKKYYALTEAPGVLRGFHVDIEGKFITSTLVILPEPIKELSAKNGSYAALSKSGNIYIWGNITTNIFSTMTKYEKVIDATSNKMRVYKVNLHQPISSIYMTTIPNSHSKLMAVSIYGKLYSLQGNEMDELTEIDIKHDVKYVAVGDSFTVTVSPDGAINYWDHQ